MRPVRLVLRHGFYDLQRRMARVAVPRNAHGSRRRFVILVLHAVGPATSDMAVSRQRLEEQLGALVHAEYRCLSLDQVLQAVSGRHALTEPSFAITFDDGYRSVYTDALPVLERLRLPATVFLTVDFLNGMTAPPWGSRDPGLLDEYRRNAGHFEPMSWTEARELGAHPLMTLGSHSLSHRLLDTLDDERLMAEARQSRRELSDRLGLDITAFSYPYGVRRYGAYSDRTERVLRSEGYRCSFTSEIGRATINSASWLLPRIPLTSDDLGVDALAKAAGRYDWVAAAQQTFQHVFQNPHGSGRRP